MKRVFILLLLLLLQLELAGQQTHGIPRLSGIVNLPHVKEAVFEFSSGPCEGPRQLVLSEGEGLWGVKVVEISPSRGAVKIALDQASEPLTLNLDVKSDSLSGPSATIELVKSSTYSVLELYGDFSRRTLLDWPEMPDVTFSLRAATTNEAEVAHLLQRALAEKGLATVPDGDQFTLVVPKDKVRAVKPGAPRAKPPNMAQARPGEVPRGVIKFHGVMLEQAFMIYAQLVGAKFVPGAPVAPQVQPFIFLYSQSPLSKEEAVYAFDTLFGWRGIKMQRAPDGTIRPVRK